MEKNLPKTNANEKNQSQTILKCSTCKKDFLSTNKKSCDDCREKAKLRKLKNKNILNEKSSEPAELSEPLNLHSEPSEPAEPAELFELKTHENVPLEFRSSEVQLEEIPNIESSLTNFDSKLLLKTEETRHFVHPFSMKVYGCRGSGKTTWVVNYINDFHHFWNSFIIVTPSIEQALWKMLKEEAMRKVIHVLPNEIDTLVNIKEKSILIFDDCMSELMTNKVLCKYVSSLYTEGRHKIGDRPSISVISLEQKVMNGKLSVQRQNTDYFVINNLLETSGIKEIAKICGYDGLKQLSDFTTAYSFCKKRKTPLICSPNYKHVLRLNFNTEIIINNGVMKLNQIVKDQKFIETLDERDEMINDLIYNYEPPKARFINKRTDWRNIKKFSLVQTYNDMVDYFSQDYRQDFYDGCKIDKKTLRYENYQKLNNKGDYYKPIGEEDRQKLVLQFPTFAKQIAEKRLLKKEREEKFKSLEMMRINNKFSDFFMENNYPEFYKGLKHYNRAPIPTLTTTSTEYNSNNQVSRITHLQS